MVVVVVYFNQLACLLASTLAMAISNTSVIYISVNIMAVKHPYSPILSTL